MTVKSTIPVRRVPLGHTEKMRQIQETLSADPKEFYIEKAREGVTDTEIARLMGVSRQQLSNWKWRWQIGRVRKDELVRR